MISKNKLKLYRQLGLKKFRQKYNLFVVEGLKSVEELLHSNWEVDSVLCTADFRDSNPNIEFSKPELIDPSDFKQISSQKKPQEVLAIVQCKEQKIANAPWSLVLDGINDPGNLGTIIRIADWYGIQNVICSTDSVDFYNPKVIQASMGSFLRVNLVEVDLPTFLRNKTVYAAMLEGESIRKCEKTESGIILIGNESNGIRPELLAQTEYKALTIPRKGQAESLNAAVATAIFCEYLTRGK